MKTRKLFYELLFGALLLLATADNGLADTPVSGPITSDTTWTLANSPYIIAGSVLVMNGVTLRIEPGVTVKFNSAKALQIDGTLIARGTSSNKVTFTSNQTTPAAGDWGYILFSNSSTDATYDASGNYVWGCILEYAVVEYAGGVNVSNNGAVRVNNAHPFINYCTIRNNSASGIYAYNLTETLKITNNTIMNNTASSSSGGGIGVDGGIITVSNNTISNNTASASGYGGGGGGISCGGSTATISNNTISTNTALGGSYYYYSGSDGGGGIYIFGGATANISNNTISNNSSSLGGGGVYIFGATATISNNLISGNTAVAQYGSGNSGGGIGIHSSTASVSKNSICNNTISGDGGGISVYQSTVTIFNNTISNNKLSSGGFSYGGGGGIIVFWGEATISNNIISENSALHSKYDGDPQVGGGIYTYYGTATLSNNSIIRNAALNASAVYYTNANAKDFRYNTIAGNRATNPDPAYVYTVYVGSHPLFNYNNIFSNTADSNPFFYELYNDNAQGSADVNTESNWWGTGVESEVQAKIYDWFDDSAKGIVDYSPYETAIRTDTPISPPTGLVVSTTDTDIILTWAPNPEGDVAGYKVYWGKREPPFFENVTNVGNALGHTIPGLTADTYYVGVTAYDTGYAAANDDLSTIVNENQTNGNESWYASSIAFVGTPEPRKLTLVTPNGGETLLAGSIFTITWQSQGPIGDVLIKYSTDNGSNWVPIGTVSNTSEYEWLVPAVTSERCLVVITDAGNSAIRDTSDDAFTIIQCSRLIPSDLNKDCYVDFYDFAAFAEDWLQCSNPLDPACTQP